MDPALGGFASQSPIPQTPAIKFFVAGRPRTKNKRKAFVVRKKGKVVGARVVQPEEDKEKQRAFAAVAQDYAPPTPWTCPVRLDLLFVMPIARSWPKKKRDAAVAGTLQHTSTPDTSRLTTFVEDALTGVMYLDDSLVVELHASKVFGHKPGVHVTLTQVEGESSSGR